VKQGSSTAPKLISAMSFSFYLFSLVPLSLALAFILPRQKKSKVKTIGKPSGFLGLNLPAVKKDFVENGHHLVAEGYHKACAAHTEKLPRLTLVS
jgi:hypothetical protein